MGEASQTLADGKAERPRLAEIAEAEWQARARLHEATVGPLIDAYRDRRSRRTTHPVHDFLFTYYNVNRRTLRQWRPSPCESLLGPGADSFLEDERYTREGAGVRLDLAKLDESSARRLSWARTLLSAAKSRPPRFNCFGLHEWAMVYRTEEIRHETTPLRLAPEEIAAVIEANAVRCSHYDAFRFFTPEAAPRNEIQPSRDDREAFEQFGCIHFNMDLYRWTYKLSPWVGADLMRDAFLLALEARELDMRASPYDLEKFGYEPIRIETASGREEYRREQERIHNLGKPIADRLLAEIGYVLSGGM